MKLKTAFRNVWKKITAKNNEGRLAIFDSVFFYAVFSLVLEFVIEIMANHSFVAALKFAIFNPLGYLVNCLFIFFTLSIAFFIPKRTFAFIFISTIWLGLGFADFVLQFKRVTPFTAVDFTLIPSVAKIFSVYLNVFEIIGICLLVVVALTLLTLAAIKLKSYKVKLKKAISVFLLSGLTLFTSINLGLWTSSLSTNFYNLNDAYADYGFPYCFVVGIFDRGIDKPSDYDKTVIDDFLNSVDTQNNMPQSTPNIVYVQLESFFDVNYLNFLTYSENPVPYFESLKGRGISGLLSVPVVGSGTVNTEFEVLTGMNLDFFGAGEYPYKTVLKSHTCESVAYNLRELGYSSHAVHNYEGSFYDRHKVYPFLGFDSFTSLEYMNDVEYNASGKWPDDSILTGEILDALKSTDTPDFVMAVSVQGHGKYPPSEISESYTEKINVSYAPEHEKDIDLLPAYSYYINQIAEMDEFIEELITAINDFEEDTVVVLYGDHLPSLSIKDEDLSKGNIYTTEYVIYSNFGLERHASYIGETFTYRLSAEVLRSLGINNGILTKLHQSCADNENYEDWFKNLCYDMLSGDCYIYNGNKNYYPVADMKMGVRDIRIKGCYVKDGYIYVEGENFTEWSKIALNEKDLGNTEFISENLLRAVYNKKLLQANEIYVTQYSLTSEPLSKTEIFYFSYSNG